MENGWKMEDGNLHSTPKLAQRIPANSLVRLAGESRWA
jgi:hypothetical protein